MEPRDAIADLGWSLLPRARRVGPVSALVAVVGLGLVAAAVIGTMASGAGLYASAFPGIWALVAAGLGAAAIAALVAEWWSGRRVHGSRLVPLAFGLVFVAPVTLVVVDLVTVVAAQTWLRPGHVRRTSAEAGTTVAESATAIAVFHLFAGPDLDASATWVAVVLALCAGTAVRLGLRHFMIRKPEPHPRRGSVAVHLTDATSFALGATVAVAALAVTSHHDAGFALGVVGTVVLLFVSGLSTAFVRRAANLSGLATVQHRLTASIAEHQVPATVAGSMRDLLRADAVLLIGPDRSVTWAAADGTAELAPSDATGDLVDEVRARLSADASSLTASPEELGALRTILGLGATKVHMISAPVFASGNAWRVLALREQRYQDPFTVAERRLLANAARLTASALTASLELARAQHDASYDELTGLTSRPRVETIIAESIAARGDDTVLAVMLIDLNGFKAVNDTLGHQTGDAVLAEIGDRLRAFTDRVDAIGRLGGDEFVILLSADDGAQVHADSVALSDDLARAVGEPIRYGDLVLDLGISVGLARCPDHGDTPSELIRAADVAMYAAKATGATVAAYEADMDRHRNRRLSLAADLRTALAAGQLTVAFQPKVSFLDGELVGAEALIRWTHPTLQAIPAGEVNEIAGHAGVLRELTAFVLEQAAQYVVRLQTAGFDVPVSVNITARDIADNAFPDRVREVLDRHGLAPDRIVLEVTETALLTREAEAVGVLPRLSELGVGLSIDDFGTGYSSLSHLRRFPVDEVKIDMSFIERMVIQPNDAVIVRSIVDLGHSLGLRVVAEGVETNEAWSMLTTFGTDVAQGNLVMRAVDADSFLAWAPYWERHRSHRGVIALPDDGSNARGSVRGLQGPGRSG